MDTLGSLRVVESKLMAGAKKAVKSGDVVHVSPAMYALLCKEEGEDLRRLLANLHFVDVGEFDFRRCMEGVITTGGAGR